MISRKIEEESVCERDGAMASSGNAPGEADEAVAS
jgi:hypothetical protein